MKAPIICLLFISIISTRSQVPAELQKEADHGDADAEVKIGLMYENGNGVAQNWFSSMEWFKKAADQGNGGGEASVGDLYFNGYGVQQDYAKAMECFKKAADLGDADAEAKIGRMYENGNGVPQNFSTAMEWYRKAADQGDGGGETAVGNLYFNGYGVQQDYAKAMECFKKAADQGDSDAQKDIGLMYENGNGVTQNLNTAMEWYKKAADQGNVIAQDLAANMFMTRGTEADYEKGMEWYKKAAAQGDSDAQESIGEIYEKGEGVTRAPFQAIYWYRMAADQGNANARAKLTELMNAMSCSSPSPPIIGQNVSLTLTDGTVKSGKVVKVDPEGISLLTDDGGGKVPFDSMTDADKSKFGYNKEAHDAYLGIGAAAPSASASDTDVPPPSAPVSKATWIQVASFSGSSDKNTEPFTIHSDRWRVRWSSKATSEVISLESKVPGLETAVSFYATAVSDDTRKQDDQDIVGKQGPGSDSTELRGAGTWSLHVIASSSNWTAVIEEYAPTSP
jgi:TPR repeat protein